MLLQLGLATMACRQRKLAGRQASGKAGKAAAKAQQQVQPQGQMQGAQGAQATSKAQGQVGLQPAVQAGQSLLNFKFDRKQILKHISFGEPAKTG